MRQHVPELRAAGGDLVLVGSGSPAFAAGFHEAQKLGDIRLFCDEELRSYALAGFRRGLFDLLHPRAAVNYVRALRSGARQGKNQGDGLQQGGAMVVLSDGSMPWKFVSRAAGDHPAPEVILAALRAAVAA